MTEKKRAATISAAEQQLEGWPLPASLVDRTLSMRKCVALLCSAVNCSWDNVEPAMPSPLCCPAAKQPPSFGKDGGSKRRGLRLTNGGWVSQRMLGGITESMMK